MNRFLTIILCVIVLMFILDTHSRADTWVVASVTSYHFDQKTQHNQINPGLGIERPLTPTVSAIFGGYRNSLIEPTADQKKVSAYAGVLWQPLHADDFKLGLAGGIVTGYESHPSPLLLPMVSWEHDRFGANLFLAPKVKDSQAVLGLQIKYKFSDF